MKRGLVAVGAVAVLLLTGCTSTVTAETITVTPGASGTFSDGDTTVVVEPPASKAPAAPVEVTTAPPKQGKASDVLVGIQLTVASYGVEVMADQIESASNYACDQLAAGVPEEQIVALTGDIPEGANRDLVQLSRDSYCAIR
ncbi:hypothetical protein B0I12_002215 [Microbacterium hydrothermale]|uniref:hypothetical protein n=1 Tax=Microbacterium hydrothermale TaxID=857427 RepID=UPI002227A8AE|nr:hypothetical protein [Microbacterium hydrothermale]MCW2165060.1 hypothetical protein [Microbacterium hydrothermale]